MEQLLQRIREHRDAGKVINISDAYRCFATDVVTDYAAPHTRDLLSTPDFAAEFTASMRKLSMFALWNR